MVQIHLRPPINNVCGKRSLNSKTSSCAPLVRIDSNISLSYLFYRDNLMEYALGVFFVLVISFISLCFFVLRSEKTDSLIIYKLSEKEKKSLQEK